MNKKLLYVGLLSCIVCTSMKSMQLTIPTNFSLTTALDKLSISTISQTASCIAGISLFYKAFDVFAKSRLPYVSETQPMPDEVTRALVCRGRKQAALRYCIGGGAFTAAVLLIKFGPQLLRKLQTI